MRSLKKAKMLIPRKCVRGSVAWHGEGSSRNSHCTITACPSSSSRRKERIMPLNKAALEAAFAALSVDGEVSCILLQLVF